MWAPRAKRVDVRILATRRRAERVLPLEPALDPTELGYFAGEHEAAAGDRYVYRLDGAAERPDPASRSQPEGVHEPSEIVDPLTHAWSDPGWRGVPLERLAIYELHVGTFSREGTFDGVIPRLDGLAELGVTALELMPVAQFPGSRNWGYDGVFPFAVQASYGGSEGLRRLADACHARGLALILDVVYNHLGPEGNYLAEFGPYFSDRHKTPWGAAINFDGPDSDEVRHFFVQNALLWIREYHVDALRIDAIHGIVDTSAEPFLAELAGAVHALGRELGREVLVIAESDLNDPRVVRPRELGGHGLDAQWSDDFHHALHALLTGERSGYYEDFGRLDQLATAYRQGFVFTGQRSAHRRRRHGAPPDAVPGERFVVSAQNHDQVGNRALGERLSTLVPFEALKLAAGALLIAPFVPLIFMGEEYADPAPFLYFIDHSDPALIEAVRLGRRAEFAAFAWQADIPDPQSPTTFERSRPDPSLATHGRHAALRSLYRALLTLRREHPALSQLSRDDTTADADEPTCLLRLTRSPR
ncbi:MAG TPA: malto-oligosyltrehalose trehalohydrolase, partial [Planctomycetota bacterium]|nr:malto-oligosyltrehalose trehalohydrolase [Planctomycetota bacterium]